MGCFDWPARRWFRILWVLVAIGLLASLPVLIIQASKHDWPVQDQVRHGPGEPSMPGWSGETWPKASKHGWSVQDQVRRGPRKLIMLGRSRCCAWVLLGSFGTADCRRGLSVAASCSATLLARQCCYQCHRTLPVTLDVPHPGQAALGRPAMSCTRAASILTYSSALQT